MQSERKKIRKDGKIESAKEEVLEYFADKYEDEVI